MIENFFTSIPNGELTFPLPVILTLLSSLAVGMIGTVLWYRKHPEDTRFLKVIAGLQLVEFLAVNIWYRVVGYLAFPLPLYHCRIAKILLILFTFLPKKWRQILRPLYIYAVVMALFGAISAFVYPNPDPFLWPHITHVGYFFGHFNLILFATAYMMEDDRPWSWKDLLSAEILLLVFNFGILLVARQTGINYSYLLESPLLNAQLQAFGPSVFVAIMFASYALLFAVAFVVILFIEKKAKAQIFLSRGYLSSSRKGMLIDTPSKH